MTLSILGSGWYGNCLTYWLVHLLTLPLELVHLRLLPSPFTGSCLRKAWDYLCYVNTHGMTDFCALIAGCLLSSLRGHVRKTVKFIAYTCAHTRHNYNNYNNNSSDSPVYAPAAQPARGRVQQALFTVLGVEQRLLRVVVLQTVCSRSTGQPGHLVSDPLPAPSPPSSPVAVLRFQQPSPPCCALFLLSVWSRGAPMNGHPSSSDSY